MVVVGQSTQAFQKLVVVSQAPCCRWLSVRLESLGALAAFAAAALAVEQRGEASTFGLVLSYALQITQLSSMTVGHTISAALSFHHLCLLAQ